MIVWEVTELSAACALLRETYSEIPAVTKSESNRDEGAPLLKRSLKKYLRMRFILLRKTDSIQINNKEDEDEYYLNRGIELIASKR